MNIKFPRYSEPPQLENHYQGNMNSHETSSGSFLSLGLSHQLCVRSRKVVTHQYPVACAKHLTMKL